MKLTDTEKKILILAMDRNAANGEVAAAATKLIELLRKRYPSGHELIDDLQKLERPEIVRVTIKSNPYSDYLMPFGKHKGRRLAVIPADYLIWVLDNCDKLNRSTRRVIETYLDGC